MYVYLLVYHFSDRIYYCRNRKIMLMIVNFIYLA